MIQEWNLATTNLHRISKRKYEVAVIPIGATEPHNFHLPQGQDVLHTTHIAHECCRRAWEKAPSVLCLPTLPFGVDCNLMDFPMAIHVSQDTLNTIVSEIIESLYHHGIRKVVILNGHGGKRFQAADPANPMRSQCSRLPMQLVDGGQGQVRRNLRPPRRPRGTDGDLGRIGALSGVG